VTFTPRATWFYKNQRTGYGWSQTLWPVGPATYEKALSMAFELSTILSEVLAEGITLYEIRVSDDAVQRDSLIDTGPLPNFNPTTLLPFYSAQAQGTIPAPDNVAQLLRLECGAFYRGSLFISGILGSYANTHNVGNPDAQWVTQTLSNLGVAISSGSWGLKVLPKDPDGAASVAIQLIAFTNGVPTITAAAHNLSSGQPVRVSGAKFGGGRFSASNVPCLVLDANNFKLPSIDKANPPTYLGGGFVKNVTAIVKPITTWNTEGIVTRKRGKIFGQRRGRV
jgi:hypothetical protein